MNRIAELLVVISSLEAREQLVSGNTIMVAVIEGTALVPVMPMLVNLIVLYRIGTVMGMSSIHMVCAVRRCIDWPGRKDHKDRANPQKEK